MWENKLVTKIFLVTLVFLVVAPNLVLSVEIRPGFNASKLIEDKTFSDTQTFGGAEGIQRFLENKNSVLANTSPDFLIRLKEPQSIFLKQALEDPRPNLGRLRTAAELIWDASIQSGLNPQVILVTLNKEQGLITSARNFENKKLQKALDRAMGFDCPDSTGCGNLFPGFYFQLFGNVDSSNNRYLGSARSLMKSFLTKGGRGPKVDNSGNIFSNTLPKRTARVGDSVIVPNENQNPFTTESSQKIVIQNNATASLYRYTPYVFNGNYNFWRYFQEWFRYQNGSILSLVDSKTNYIIVNGSRQLLPNFVALARGINMFNKITVSPNEVADYPEDKPYGPQDNTLVKLKDENKQFVFLQDIKHPVSDFVLKQRGINPEQYLVMTVEEDALFKTGSQLPPKDGSIVRGKKSSPIYLVADSKLKLFSDFTYKQNKKPKPILVEDTEIVLYEKLGFVPPLNNTLVKSATKNAPIYLTENGLKRPVTNELFKNRGFNTKNVAVISDDEIGALPNGDFITPKEKTYFAVGSKTGQLYYFKDGAKRSISSFVAKQRKITPDFVFGQEVVETWADGIAVAPKDGTIVKGSNESVVYIVQKGQLRPLTEKAFKNRKITAKKINILSQDEVDSYAKGEILEK